MNEPARLYAVTAEMEQEDAPSLLLDSELAYVTETPTGLAFDPTTPIELWAALVTRLQRQSKVIEWALADAINFGDQAFGEMHAQWVDETGLAKRTLQNIARIGREIPPARRRADVSFSHHAEVITLPISEQEALLDRAESAGMTRYDLRDAVRERKRALEGQAVDAAGEPVCLAELAWCPDESDLTEDARRSMNSAAPLGRLRSAWISGYLRALIWADQESAFLPGRWQL